MPNYPRLLPAGDHGLVIEFGDSVDPALNARVQALAAALTASPIEGLGECVPTYRSLLVHYDPLRLGLAELTGWVNMALERLADAAPAAVRRVDVPVEYGGPAGPDLEFVARHTGLDAADVIRLHSEPEYVVYMMGFTPGYPYMGKLLAPLVVPRLETPRPIVPAGSVGIAGWQTGIYPMDSPGGWRILGRTNLRLFDPNRQPPFLFAPGDRVRFIPLHARR